ncbi:uncharacterized protein LOC108455587 [Gossypium arboreum]|uniref:uncharacterized protein LOC108455587 n=1 Tax=Gossypium arboreum TaxID=29729 RepID=UPI0022F15EB5|nr:uncharacterized protein LOC108455587 [Gossypium arboreum]
MNKLSFLLFLLLVVSFAFVNGEKSKDDKSKDDKSKDDKSKDDKSKHEVGICELKNGNMSVKFTNWGASVISIILPDKDGKPGDIVLGYDDVKEYMSDANYFGSVLGRVANRIAGAKLPLNGAQFTLPANDGKNTLNGGPKGFSDVIWEMKKIEKDAEDPTIVFAYHSKDGDEGNEDEHRQSFNTTAHADGYGLHEFVLGTVSVPPQSVVDKDGNLVPNPEFLFHKQQDKLLASWLLTTICDEILVYLTAA